MTNYLLISSTYRDRLLYPNPADFVIPIGSNNNMNSRYNVFTTTNPITKSFPEYNNCWTNFFSNNENTFPTNIISMNGNSVTLDTNVNEILLGISENANQNDLIVFQQDIENCYDILKGFFLQINILGNDFYRQIIAYDPVSSIAYLRNSFPIVTIPEGGYACNIFNSFEMNPVQNPSPGNVFVTINGDFLRESPLIYYDSDVFLYNVNQNEFRKTIQYETEFHKYVIEKPFTNMKTTDQYFLFGNNVSSFCGTMNFLANNKFYTYVPSTLMWFHKGNGYQVHQRVRFETDENFPDDYYHEFIIQKTNFNGEILDDELKLVKIGKQAFHSNIPYKVMPLQNAPSFQPATVQISSLSLAFSLHFKSEQPMPQSLMGMYFFPIIMSNQYQQKGKTIRFQPNSTIIAKNQETKPIDLLSSQSETGVCGIKSVHRENDTYVLVTQQYTNVEKLEILSKAKETNTIPEYCQGIENFLILNFSCEGVVPLNYTGSQITQSQMSCYEISVTSLILPNVILQTTSGLLTSSYPFLFVEITNETSPNSGNTDIIYSNNPHASKSTFICPTLDVNNPETTKFIKIGAGSGSQIMKFTPYDNLRVRISLPNGETFKTEINDHLVPNNPNLRIQITLLLEIKKI